jgi:hypothetical protein
MIEPTPREPVRLRVLGAAVVAGGSEMAIGVSRTGALRTAPFGGRRCWAGVAPAFPVADVLRRSD